MLTNRCLAVCQSCSVGILSPNGWMDQDATWYGGRPGPRRHCVRWEPCPPQKKGGGKAVPHFSTHVCCGQKAGWIKMPLGTDVRLGPGHIVLDGYPSLLPKGAQHPHFSVHICRDQTVAHLSNCWILVYLGLLLTPALCNIVHVTASSALGPCTCDTNVHGIST